MKKLFSSKIKYWILLIVLPFKVYTSNAQSYTLTDDDVVVENGIIYSCSYDFEIKNIIIPQILDGQDVVGIADSYGGHRPFIDKGITSLVLPSTMKKISHHAFERNDISSLDLSNCTSLDSIGERAFQYNSIESLDLSNCSALINIEASAFFYNSITSLDLSNCSALEYIGDGAFSGNQIASLDFSKCIALTSIGMSAFSSNSISNVDLSGCINLLLIGEGAFFNNLSLAGFTLPEVTYNSTVYNTWKDGNNNSYTAETELVTDLGAFYVCFIPYTLTDDDVVVENGILTSCSYDFELKNIIIPQTLDGQSVIAIDDGRIHQGSFHDKGITSVVLPASLERIGDYSFQSNDITSLDLSNCTVLDTIGERAFNYNSIASLDLSNCIVLSLIGKAAFYYNSIVSLELSNCTALKFVGEYAFSENQIESLDLSDCTALAAIGENAFNRNLLTNVNLSGCSSLLLIENRAFSENGSLGSFSLPVVTYKGIEYNIWNDGNNNSYTAGTDLATDFNTFYVCFIPYTLIDDDVVVENGIITSCNYDFELKDIVIPSNLDGQTVIGIADGWGSYGGLFYKKGITSVLLPSTLERTGDFTFADNNITSLDLSNCTALETIGERAFHSNSLLSLDFSNCSALTSIEESAFSTNYSITSVDLSNCAALVSIGEYAFGFNKISVLNLSSCSALKFIGENAFNQNILTSIDLTTCSSLLWIGPQAFYNNWQLTGFSLPIVSYEGAEYLTWKDENDSSYLAGSGEVTDLKTFYLPFIQYTLTDDDVVVQNGIITSCSYAFELRNIIIPDTLDGQTVIGTPDDWYRSYEIFNRKEIASLELPSSIETIGRYTFNDNYLANIDFSNCTKLTTIGERAFYNNRIQSLDLSNCKLLSTIDESAFNSNIIDDVDLSSCSNLLSIGKSAFNYNPSVSDFALPDPIINGYFYSYWVDEEGNSYDPISRVSNLALSYTRIMPEIDSVDPVYSATAGNTEITISGKNFENERKNKMVLFNGKESLGYQTWSDTVITVTCPPNPEGAVKIEIPLENNLTFNSPKQFYYTDDEINVVCGNVSGTWEKDKIFLLSCSVNIPKDSALLVEEGVMIIAMPGEQIRFNIYGSIEVKGTPDNPVTFTSATKIPDSWSGVFIDGTYDDCIFTHSVFEYAKNGISLSGWADGCYSVSNYSEFYNCIIRNNSENGVFGGASGDSYSGCSLPKTGVCSPVIQNCQIYNNGKNGIEFVAWDGYRSNGYIGAKVYNNLIYSNLNGIYCHGSDWVEPKIINNVIAKNTFAGINSTHKYFDQKDYVIANNVITNSETGLLNSDTSIIALHNNDFWSNTIDVDGAVLDESNIYQNPLFSDSDNDDYALLSNSPCVDAGSNDFVSLDSDIENNARIWDGNNDGIHTVDIGAYEYGSPCYSFIENVTICEGDTYKGWSESGTYTDSHVSITGCDSVIVTVLTVIASLQPEVFNNNDTLSTTLAYQSYKWYKNEGNVLVGTESEYSVTESGEYYLVVSDEHGCVHTSEIVYVEYTAIPENQIEEFTYSIIPNPNNGEFTFRITSGTTNAILLKLINALGQIIEIRDINTSMENHAERFEVPFLSQGIYHLIISSDKSHTSERIVIH